jgi:hypothetical protein
MHLIHYGFHPKTKLNLYHISNLPEAARCSFSVPSYYRCLLSSVTRLFHVRMVTHPAISFLSQARLVQQLLQLAVIRDVAPGVSRGAKHRQNVSGRV